MTLKKTTLSKNTAEGAGDICNRGLLVKIVFSSSSKQRTRLLWEIIVFITKISISLP